MYFMSIIVASQLKSLNILSLLPPSFLSSFFKQIITVSSILLLYYQFPSCNRLNSCCLGFGLGCSSAQLYLLYLYYHFTYNKNIFFKNKVVSLCNYCNRKKCISIFNKMLYSTLEFHWSKIYLTLVTRLVDTTSRLSSLLLKFLPRSEQHL